MIPDQPISSKSINSSTSLLANNQPQTQTKTNQSFHIIKAQTFSAPRLSLPIKEPLNYIVHTHNYLVGAAPSKIVVYSFIDKLEHNIKVCTEQFVLLDFPPYVFGCLITQFLYLYSQQALNDVSKIIKMKISKLNVMAICVYNKGYFMGGYNRSPLPGGNLINKRTIYFIQDLTSQQKNKPKWQINIPKNSNPITILQMQNPYLMCYCEPHTYIINPQTREVLVSFQKQFTCLSLLQGRYSLNCVNMIGISCKQKTLISVDVQKYPIYGVELNQLKQKASSVCQSREGIIYACYKNTIFSYNIFKKQKKVVKQYQDYQEVIQLICSPKNVLVALIISRQPKEDQNGFVHYGSMIDMQKQKQEDMPKSMDFGLIDSVKDKPFENEQDKSISMSINREIEEKRIIQVFSITI